MKYSYDFSVKFRNLPDVFVCDFIVSSKQLLSTYVYNPPSEKTNSTLSVMVVRDGYRDNKTVKYVFDCSWKSSDTDAEPFNEWVKWKSIPKIYRIEPEYMSDFYEDISDQTTDYIPYGAISRDSYAMYSFIAKRILKDVIRMGDMDMKTFYDASDIPGNLMTEDNFRIYNKVVRDCAQILLASADSFFEKRNSSCRATINQVARLALEMKRGDS